jgi:hypothetical protein
MERLYNLVVDVADVAFVLCLLVLLPLALFRSKRRLAGVGLKCASLIFALNLWMYALGALWHYWGLIAVIVDILFTPIGASLIAGIAVTMHRNWWALFVIVSYIVMVLSAYAGGEKLIESGHMNSV